MWTCHHHVLVRLACLLYHLHEGSLDLARSQGYRFVLVQSLVLSHQQNVWQMGLTVFSSSVPYLCRVNYLICSNAVGHCLKRNASLPVSYLWVLNCMLNWNNALQRAQSTCFVITASRQGSCVHFIAKLWSDYNVNYDDINRSTHPDEQYYCVNSYTNHALCTPAVSTGTRMVGML